MIVGSAHLWGYFVKGSTNKNFFILDNLTAT